MLPLIRLHRHHPAVYAVPVFVAALTIYYLHQSPLSIETTPQPGLRRSNAQRRRRSRVDSSEPTRVDLGFLDDARNDDALGRHVFQRSSHVQVTYPIRLDTLDAFEFFPEDELTSPEQAELCRSEVQDAILSLYLYQNLPPLALDHVQEERVVSSLETRGFAPDRIRHFLAINQCGELPDHISSWISTQISRGSDIEHAISNEPLRRRFPRVRQDLPDAITENDLASENSWGADVNKDEDQSESKNLLALLYAMAQDKNRREGFVHRGITCNCCGTHPIKGIRYRCTTCNDFDMCEVCEGQGYHTPTHLLYKIRIPRSHLGSQAQPVLYPGKYSRYSRSMTTQIVEGLVKFTGFTEAEVEGFWEQFRCLASADLPDDPFKYGLAIDRRGFEQLLYPSNSARPSAPNLIYDRIFSFYDSNDDDLIGFYEFIEGLSNLRKKGPKEKWKRIFRCFDIDRDGYINRKDFLRMFRAHYSITREMTAEIVANMEEDSSDEDLREMITSGQPISASFTSQSPMGQPSRIGAGKRADSFGDYVTIDRRGVLGDDKDAVDLDQVVAQRAEHQEFGSVDQDPVTFETRDVRDKIKSLQKDPWPSGYISVLDVESALGENRELDMIQDLNEQMSVRRVAQRRLAWDWQRRHFVRLQSLRTRKKRAIFFLNEDALTSNHDIVSDQLFGKSFSDFSSPQGFLTGEIRTLGDAQRLRDDVDKLLKDSSLDFGSGKLKDLLLILFEVGFSISDTVENLKGYTLDDEDLQSFATSLFNIFNKYSPDAELEKNDGAGEPKEVNPQVSIGYTLDPPLMASPPVLESNVHPQVSKSDQSEMQDEDVGQEMLFQVTQEALNELIDPFLKPREDLWLEARTTKAKRTTYRDAICEAVNDPIDTSRLLKAFLKHIQITPDYPPPTEHWAQALRSEATNFREFYKLVDEDVMDGLTSQACSKCSRRVYIGMFCEGCGTGSAVAQMLFSNQATTETCKFCSTNGVTRQYKSDYDVCRECISPSAKRAKDSQWLWEVLSGDPGRAEIEQGRRRTRYMEQQKMFAERLKQYEDLAKRVTPIQEAHASPGHDEVSNVSAGKHEISSPELSQGHTSPSAADSANPATPFGGNYEVIDLDIMGNEIHQNVQHSHQLVGYEDPILASGEQDMALEVKISQKPLQELLDDAGFTIKNEEGEKNQSTPSPTPSQHPPRSSSLPDLSYSYSARDAYLYADPTLPQNRPNSVPQEPNHPLETPTSQEPPNQAILKFWAALNILEAEDERIRGGPGRLSEQEFLDIMLGERGKSLEFVGDWMNLTAF